MSKLNWSHLEFVRDGVKLHCWKKGAGAPLVLLHGITDNGPCWGRTADALAANYTVYALDQRGHGQSDAPSSGYAYAEYVSDVVELLRVNNHANAIFMGHSFGGMIAMTLAATHPTYVSKLILVDPPLLDIPLSAPAAILDEQRYAWFEWLRQLKPLSREELIGVCEVQSPKWSRDECEHWADSKLQFSPRLWEKEGVQMGTDWRTTLSKISCPTLLIYGDPALRGIVDNAKANTVVGLLQNGQAEQIQNAGHSVYRDEYAAFMNAVNKFLTQPL
jgi:N-formylmaleamate deformylase